MRRPSRSSPNYGGEFPQEPAELQTLPGIGRYTAGAIASIAFDQRAAILEANTIRLLSRLIGLRGNPHSTAGQRHSVAGGRRNLAAEARGQIQSGAHGVGFARLHARVNRSVTIARWLRCVPPTRPACSARSRARNRGPYSLDLRETAVIVRKNGSVLMRRCAEGERWAGLWDFPRFELEASGPLFAKREIVAKVAAQTGITCSPSDHLKTHTARRHSLSHHA